jgi:helix-turn-helix resolvase-like protein
MPQPRKFDHDEAIRRYANGETGVALAEEYGVSTAAVYRVVNPEIRAYMDKDAVERNRRKREPCRGGCGRLVWRHGRVGRARSGYCPTCNGIQRAESVRPTTLRCSHCREWKRDDAFPRRATANARRGRSHECRVCQTITRRERRQRNAEADRAYQRAYKKRVRAHA